SVFGALPGEGRWATALLIDGNIGIGGDPVALLRRVAELLRPAGVVLVELDAPGAPTEVVTVRMSTAGDDAEDDATPPRRPPLRLHRRKGEPLRSRNIRPKHVGPWFPWARVGADGWQRISREAGLTTTSLVELGGRWFAQASAPLSPH
ncbi:MAG: hypothetical protein M3P34_11540, partial [Actinomycetota bacterium]|nr:hypothetical protein [Actinomycetota bacterium]